MLTVALERLAGGLLEEMQPLLLDHHRYLGKYQEQMPLDPQYEVYLQAEMADECICAALRENGKLVGYHVSFVRRGLHYRQTITGTQDILWVSPEARRQGGGMMLFDAVEREWARRMGPSGGLGLANSKLGGPDHAALDKLLTARGYVPMDLYYAKWIKP